MAAAPSHHCSMRTQGHFSLWIRVICLLRNSVYLELYAWKLLNDFNKFAQLFGIFHVRGATYSEDFEKKNY